MPRYTFREVCECIGLALLFGSPFVVAALDAMGGK
jgi:hypothetical protein